MHSASDKNLNKIIFFEFRFLKHLHNGSSNLLMFITFFERNLNIFEKEKKEINIKVSWFEYSAINLHYGP